VLVFNKIKPEDCVFGDSIGEGIYTQIRSFPDQVLNYRCVRQREGGMVERLAKQEVCHQNNEKARDHQFQTCRSH